MNNILSQLSTYLPIQDHTWIFFLVLCIILFIPMLFERLHIPQFIGMILAGIVVGEYGFNLLERDNSFELFGQVGLYYIMFNAGLSMKIEQIKKNLKAGLIFSVLTFFLPFAIGFCLLHVYIGYGVATSLLLASIFGSHTLLAFPIVSRYGLTQHKSVTIAVGGTLVSLLLALLILSSIIQSYSPNSSHLGIFLILFKCGVLITGVLLILPRLIRYFFRNVPDSILQYIFVLSIIFFCAALANVLDLEGILGAFLAGIILGRYIPTSSPLMNRIEFVGNALFIPYFLIGVGMLINLRLLFTEGVDMLYVVFLVVSVATLTKLLVAYLTQWICKLGKNAGLMLFGLTEAHAAGALAMVMIGVNTKISEEESLVSPEVFNVFVMLLLFSCLLSFLITEKAAKRLRMQEEKIEENPLRERILIALAHEETVENLVNVALMMRKKNAVEPLVATSIVVDKGDDHFHIKHAQKLLAKAQKVAAGAEVEMLTQYRIAVNVSMGIVHFMQESEATDLLLGLHIKANYADKFYGKVIQNILQASTAQIIIQRLLQPLNTLRLLHVLVPQKAEYESGFRHWIDKVRQIAEQMNVPIVFYGDVQTTLFRLSNYIGKHFDKKRITLKPLTYWDNLLSIAPAIQSDHLLIIVQARKGTFSYHTHFEQLPGQIERYFSSRSLLLIYPNQYGDSEKS